MRLLLDIETTLDHSKIWCVVTKDLDTQEVRTWKEAKDLSEYIKAASLIVAHNGIAFDFYLLNKLWKCQITLKRVRDTLVLSRLLNPSLEGGHSLANLGKLLGIQKSEFNDFDLQTQSLDEMVQYCKQDVEVLHRIYNYLEAELKRQEFSPQSQELEHEVQAIIAVQERNGFKFDEQSAMRLLAELKAKLDAITVEMQGIFPPRITSGRTHKKTGKPLKDIIEPFNPGSRQQIAERLIEKGWKPEKFTEKGSVIVDETTLEGLDFPEAKAIAEYLMLQKRIAQIESWIEHIQADGRVHGKVITNGAISGRATHHSPNMAQVPNLDALYGKECRALWTVDQGNVLVGVDLAQLELRCLAHYMNDDDYTKTLLEGDIHEKNRLAAGLNTRAEAKRFGFAFLYGAGASKIGTILGCSPQEGARVINRYLKALPKLEKLRQKVEKHASTGQIPGLDGRRLNIRSTHSALNTLLQGAGAIISKQWIREATKELRRRKIHYRLIAWVHDEIQIETAEADGEIVGQICVEAARTAGNILNTKCPMDAEYHIGRNWSESH